MLRVMSRGDSSVASFHAAIAEMDMARNEFLYSTSKKTFLEASQEGSSFPTFSIDDDDNLSDAPSLDTDGETEILMTLENAQVDENEVDDVLA
eukprot:4101098-Pyramimonas_sp.AAC.1